MNQFAQPNDSENAPCHGGQRFEDCAHCHVRRLAICGALEPAELEPMARLVTHKRLAKGDQLFEENAAADHVYTLTSGAMRLCKLLPDGRRQIIGFALPGDFLGLTASQRYFYSAESIAETTLCRFKQSDLAVLFRLFPHLQDRLLRMTSGELAAAQDQMLSLGRKEPVERVASFLASLARRMRRFGDPGPTVTLPMTRADIADYLGLTIETISRSFTKLKSARIIVLPSPERVFVADPARLAALARGEAAQSGPGHGSE